MGIIKSMTQITRDDIARLAVLSKLQLTDEEIDSLKVDLSSILEYVDQLNELDTSEVEPTYQVIDLENVWRDDATVPPVASREELLALAPESDNNQVKVPKVL